MNHEIEDICDANLTSSLVVDGFLSGMVEWLQNFPNHRLMKTDAYIYQVHIPYCFRILKHWYCIQDPLVHLGILILPIFEK